MNDDFNLSDMYSDNDAPVTPAKSYKQLSGLKLTGSHMTSINVGEQLVDVPRIAYVKLLEDQIKELRRELREMQNNIRRIARTQDKISNNLNNVERELDNKVDLR